MTSSPNYIDSHCHLDCLSSAEDLSTILTMSRRAGVNAWIVPAIEPSAWPTIKRVADNNGGVFPAYGVHPQWADRWSAATADELCRVSGEAVAIGEIGLDYTDCGHHRQLQQELFAAQLRIARKAKLPVLIHCRKAFDHFLTISRREGLAEVGGIMHAFSGSLEIAKECIKLGMLIGIAGPITYSGAARLPKLVAELGLRHLVLETDSPDLTPEPLRGTQNVPANLPLIAARVAELCGATIAEVAAVTTENVMRVLKLAS